MAIVTPYLAASNAGNWHTAARWARHLSAGYRVSVMQRWQGEPADCLIALHARRSAESIEKFAAAHPDRPLVVVLTGTDLYRDIDDSREARRSLALATRLVVLNQCGPQRLPSAVRAKVQVILQSAPALTPGRPPQGQLSVAVVGHLRNEKNPRLVWALLRRLPVDLRLRICHIGAPLDEALGREAARVAAADRRYRWLGELPRAHTRQIVRASHLLLHPSKMEGGAQAVIASDIDGNIGLLGAGYPGLFADDDADSAAALLIRVAQQPSFLKRLRSRCAARSPMFAPAREGRALRRLVDNCLREAARSKR